MCGLIKSCFFERINRIGNLLPKLRKKEKAFFVRNYYEQLYSSKLNNLGEMDKFREICKLPRLNRDQIENVNRPIISKEIE